MQQGNRPGWLPEVQEMPRHVRSAQSPFLECLHVIRSGWFRRNTPFVWEITARTVFLGSRAADQTLAAKGIPHPCAVCKVVIARLTQPITLELSVMQVTKQKLSYPCIY
jgi:hypothetical protein